MKFEYRRYSTCYSHFHNIFTIILNFLLQTDEESGGKKARVKKPYSKYNEEISSESEAERFVSNVKIGCAQQAKPCHVCFYTVM